MVLTLRKVALVRQPIFTVGFGHRLRGGSDQCAAVLACRTYYPVGNADCGARRLGCLLDGWHRRQAGPAKLRPGHMVYPAPGLGCFLVAFLGVFQTRSVWRDRRVDRDGNVLRITWKLENRDRTCVVTDADGRPLSAYDGVDIDDPAEDAPERFAGFSSGLIDQERLSLPWRFEADMFGYRTPTPGIVGLRAVAKSGIRFRRTCLFDVSQQIIDVSIPIPIYYWGRLDRRALRPTGFCRRKGFREGRLIR